jgi:2-polyprenyl-3-methyl-5-hydroxy-6-metoxy-1,4-benzoquinol methylase
VSDIRKHKSDWDRLGDIDPMWAILSDPAKKFGKWDEETFFNTGEAEIAEVMQRADTLGYPKEFKRALDFGCGVGRLTRPLSRRFANVHGVDVSASMVEKAREMNRSHITCEFHINERTDLGIFSDSYFDFIYSSIVLQHLPDRRMVFGYISEFLRVVKPEGLVVFQIPNSLPFLVRLQPRRRLFMVLRAIGIPERTLYWKFGLHPIRMKYVPRAALDAFIIGKRAEILRIDYVKDQYFPVESSLYFLTKKS